MMPCESESGVKLDPASGVFDSRVQRTPLSNGDRSPYGPSGRPSSRADTLPPATSPPPNAAPSSSTRLRLMVAAPAAILRRPVALRCRFGGARAAGSWFPFRDPHLIPGGASRLAALLLPYIQADMLGRRVCSAGRRARD